MTTEASGKGLDFVESPSTPTTGSNEMLPMLFTVPALNPAPGGLVQAVTWTEQVGDATRWLSGVQLEAAKVGNYSGDLSSGVWGADWCSDPGSGSGAAEVKDGTRPADPAPFWPVTAWAFDSCDLRPQSRAETIARARQVLRMRWPVLVAREFAARLVADAGGPLLVDDLTEAVGELEALFAEQNVTGVVHCSPFLLPHLVSHMLATRGGVGGYMTASGHAIVADGGYRPVLGDNLLVATSSPLFGWRNTAQVRESIDYGANTHVVLAERSSLVACEQVLGAVEVGQVGS